MVDISFIERNVEAIKKACRQKHIDLDLGKLLDLNRKIRNKRRILDIFRAERTALAKLTKVEMDINKMMCTIGLPTDEDDK